MRNQSILFSQLRYVCLCDTLLLFLARASQNCRRMSSIASELPLLAPFGLDTDS